MGRRKTLSKITSKFYRPLIKEEIKNCIKECDSCQKIKGNIHKHNAELLHLAPSRPNQTNTITFVEGQINKRVKDKLNNRISPKNPRCKMKEIKRKLTIQNERINESNAPSRSQKDKTHQKRNYNGDVSDIERTADISTVREKRKYNKNPNHPRWKKKVKCKMKDSSEIHGDKDSDGPYDPGTVLR